MANCGWNLRAVFWFTSGPQTNRKNHPIPQTLHARNIPYFPTLKQGDLGCLFGDIARVILLPLAGMFFLKSTSLPPSINVDVQKTCLSSNSAPICTIFMGSKPYDPQLGGLSFTKARYHGGLLPGCIVTVAGLFKPSPSGGFLLVSGYTKTLAEMLPWHQR